MANISEFYKRLRDLCEQKGMTVNELAKNMGLSSGSPTAWKNGAVPRETTIAKIAAYFGVSVGYLTGKEENTPAENGKRAVSDDEIKFALFGGDGEITDEMFEEVKRFAEFVKQRGPGKK